jgi:DNA-binding MarR family transcriptional regulator
MAAKEPNINQSERYAAELLELFYPIHYRGNMAVEDAMRGELTRKQAAIMWLIRSAGDNGRELRRKEIVRRLQDWFDVSSPAVTKALRHMARAPLGLVRLVEDSDSGREKRVVLTQKGERFLLAMVARGRDFLQRAVVGQLAPDQLRDGIEFLRAGVAAYERFHAQSSTVSGKGAARKSRSAKSVPRNGSESPSPRENSADPADEEPDRDSRPAA